MTSDLMALPVAFDERDAINQLVGILIDQGAIDQRGLERARRVASETNGRLDQVLTQLGLVTERMRAEALAELVAAPLLTPSDYPRTPLLLDRLRPKFLRKAQVLPISASVDRVVIAMVDPLDDFTRKAVAATLGRQVTVAVANPVDLEAALERLYADLERGHVDAAGLVLAPADSAPSDEDAERLRDLASEAPVIRLTPPISI
jgi:general secretion pathway protein E